MSVKKRILLIAFTMILFVTASFAWINERLNPTGRYMTFSFQDNEAVIASTDLDVKLYYDATGDDEFVDMTKLFSSEENTELFSFSDFEPGAQKKFRADIVNKGDTPLFLRVVLSDIVCDSEEMQGLLEIGTSGYESFPATVITPKLEEKTLADGMNNGSFTLVNSVEVPPGEEAVSIYFYVTLSRAATDSTSNKSFTIGKITFMAI